MMHGIIFKPCLSAAIALLVTSGCVHDMYFVSGKERRYNVVPAFTPAKITPASWIDPADHSSALYTSSTATTREHRHDNLLGRLHLYHSDDPKEEPLVISVRREHRLYTAETPISTPIRAGEREITPHFMIGRHRDHKEMVGIVFRMPF